MIGHDDELMDLEFAGQGVRAEDVDQKLGRGLPLEKMFALNGPGGNEECPDARDNRMT